MAKIRKVPKGTLRRVLSYASKYKGRMLLSLASTLLSVVLSLFVPMLLGRAIDRMIGEGAVDLPYILTIFLAVGCAVGASALLTWCASAINNRVTYRIVRDVRIEAFEKLQTLPLSYFDSHPKGETVARIISDVDVFADGLLLGFTQLFSGVITIVGTLVFMIATSPLIALAVVVLTPTSLLIARFIATRSFTMFRRQSDARATMTGKLEETLGESRLVRAFSMGDEMLADFDESNRELEGYSLSAIFFSSLVNPTTRFINASIYAVVALVGAIGVIRGGVFGALTVGALTALLSYVNQYTKPFNEISGVVTEFSGALASGARVFELIDEVGEVDDEGALPSAVQGNVTLDRVSFSYTKEQSLIEDLSLLVRAGEHVAIVGPTGCGKTTLINLLMRFYDVSGGRITLEGTDIREISRGSLRRSYGMVLQDTWIKHATVRENIAMGKPDATDEEIEAAARATHAHSFIKRLPKGYDTLVSDTVGGLSEGQKQLLCITRVMLAAPPMLILDEATSSIDTRTELRIQRAFDKLMAGRTTFIVAHRLSTVRDADVILVMRDGKIVEQGSHEALLKKGGFYRELYESGLSGIRA